MSSLQSVATSLALAPPVAVGRRRCDAQADSIATCFGQRQRQDRGSKPEESHVDPGRQGHQGRSLIGVVSSDVPYQEVAIGARAKRPRIIFEDKSGLATVVAVDSVIQIADRAAVEAAAKSAETPVAASDNEAKSAGP